MAIKVLIIGSQRGDEGDATAFRDACREIGETLARNGMEVIVGSARPTTADRHVIDGIAAAPGQHKVRVVRPRDGDLEEFDKVNHPNVRFDFDIVRGSWAAGRVPQILAADVVLMIGGSERAAVCGYVAPALERPVLPIGSFGGAAKSLVDELAPSYRGLGRIGEHIRSLERRWKKGESAATVHAALVELVQFRPFTTKPRLPISLFVGLLIVCLAAWVALFTTPIKPAPYSLFLMVAVAGLMGTMLRNNLRMLFDRTARFSWNELFIEIGAGLVLGFALALLYLAGAVTVTGSTATLAPADDAGFQRVAIVMTLLGLGAGMWIEQAADRLRRWFGQESPGSRS